MKLTGSEYEFDKSGGNEEATMANLIVSLGWQKYTYIAIHTNTQLPKPNN